MTVSTQELADAKAVVIKVNGRFDFSCHQEFMGGYKAFPKGSKQYVVDLKDTEYMDSSAMGMLLQLREYGDKALGVELINVNGNVNNILKIANFGKLFTIREGDA